MTVSRRTGARAGWTELALNGRYRPPVGGVRRVVDRMLLHWLAEATVKDFMDRVAELAGAHAVRAGQAMSASHPDQL